METTTELLASLSLEQLSLSPPLAELKQQFDAGGRTGFLAYLKEQGVAKLADRQKLANGMSKAVREGTLGDLTTAAATTSAFKSDAPSEEARPQAPLIVCWNGAGLTMKEVAARMGVSYHTVDTHVRHVYAKLQVRSRGGAVAKALRERIV